MGAKHVILKAKDIHKRYGSLHVLKGVSLDVLESEVLAIVGASGAGKSTLLHIMGALDLPDSGTVSLNGTSLFNLDRNKLAAFRNKHIGFIFQFHNLLPEFSAIENVMMPGWIGGQPKTELKHYAEELFELLGISARAEHKPSELSGGEQQRVAVARALINKPSLVMADEPSGNLDSKNAKELHELFFKLRDKMGQTFVIVTHNQDLAQMADRRVEMQDGLLI